MVFGEGLDGWKRLMDVPELKEASVKAAQEEENTQAILTALPAEEEQVFVNDDGVMTGALSSMSSTAKSEDKKYFVADDGVRYAWDDAEQDWVEDDEPLDSDNETESQTDPALIKGKKASTGGVGSKEGSGAGSGARDDDEGADGEECDEAGGVPGGDEKQKRKRKKRKKKSGQEWNAAASKLWVYISGLPLDITVDEMKAHFSKVRCSCSPPPITHQQGPHRTASVYIITTTYYLCNMLIMGGNDQVGIIAISPLDQQPKIKLYRDDHGNLKGDASICYNAEASVEMAVSVLDGGFIRPMSKPLSVSRAEFQKKEGGDESTASVWKKPRQTLTHAQVKVTQNAMAQALAWNEDDDLGMIFVGVLYILFEVVNT